MSNSLPAGYLRVANAITEEIAFGAFPPGSQLPSISTLAKQHRVSLTTVVQAQAILRAQGLIVGRAGKGSYVCGANAADEHVPQVLTFGYIYVIAFSNGVVKIGLTANPKQRLGSHASEFARHGTTVLRSWVSPPDSQAVAHEDALKTFAAQRYQLAAGKEYFRDADFDALVTFAKSLSAAGRRTDADPNGQMALQLHDEPPAPPRRKPVMAAGRLIRVPA